jgi:segregation and condensation protein B
MLPSIFVKNRQRMAMATTPDSRAKDQHMPHQSRALPIEGRDGSATVALGITGVVEDDGADASSERSLTTGAAGLEERREQLRTVEALLFASAEPLEAKSLATYLPPSADIAALLIELQTQYAGRGVNLVRAAGKWSFRTASSLGYLLERTAETERRLSRAALETLAIIAYHQPVTRAEIEDIRGVATSKGTLDVLLETGWVRLRGRRRAPGRPVTYGTSDDFLAHFGLDTIGDLPGTAELRAAGLLDSSLPEGFRIPDPRELAKLQPDELPLETGDREDAAEDLSEHSSADGPDPGSEPSR